MRTVLVLRGGLVERTHAVDPGWLDPQAPGAPEVVWLDIAAPQEADRRLLAETFHVHELAIEDAISEMHHPKIETYDTLLYLVLHGIVSEADRGGFVTQDVDFLIGPRFLITVHHVKSRSIEAERDVCQRHPDLFAEGPVSLCHRIVDRMVDHYAPEVDALEDRLEALEAEVFEAEGVNPMRALLALKHDVGSLRRVTLPQRDAIGRLARREFTQISERLAYRFRDVHDHLVRFADEASFLQDRVTGLIDAYLSSQSNRLNQVMKVLTIIATIFMPLTLLASLYGMNVNLPRLPGSDAMQFWWIAALMLGGSGLMLWFFRRMRWL